MALLPLLQDFASKDLGCAQGNLFHGKTRGGRPVQVSLWHYDYQGEARLRLYLRRPTQTAQQQITESDLLKIITELQSDYLTDLDHHMVFGKALDKLLQLTASEYGFIGDVLINDDGQPYLRTRAITNLAWNADMEHFYRENAPGGMCFYNLQSLFGYTVRSGEVLVANDPAAHSERTGLPPGHPALNHYLGIPIKIGPRFVGMAGIANRPGGYDESLVELIKPLMQAIGQLLQAFKHDQERRTAEQALRDSESKLKQYAQELEQSNYKLLQRTKELDQATKAKSMFLAKMSHELRTPLNSILGFSRRLTSRLQESLSERDGDALSTVVRNGEHLLRMINDILDLSKIEAGHLELLPSDCSGRELMDEAIIQVAGLAHARQVEVVMLNSDEVSLYVDKVRTQQVLINLLGNAIKYGGGSTVEIQLTVDRVRPGFAHFSVRDYGPGIAREHQSRLFQRYSQVAENIESTNGTGLGLALVSELTQLHGGEVSVVSELGQGAEFSVWLPINGSD